MTDNTDIHRVIAQHHDFGGLDLNVGCTCTDGIDQLAALLDASWTDPGPCPTHDPDGHAEAARQAELAAAQADLDHLRNVHAIARQTDNVPPLNSPPEGFAALAALLDGNNPGTPAA